MAATLSDAALAGLVEGYAEQVKAANEIATEVKAARSKPEEALAAILDTSDDANIVKWREADKAGRAKIAEAIAKLDAQREAVAEYAKTLLPTAAEGFDIEARTKAFIAERAAANTLRKALLTLVHNDQERLTRLLDAAGVVEIVSLGKDSTGGKAKGATGIRRPRITAATVNGETLADGNGKVSVSFIASHLGIDGDVIRKAMFTAAGTEDLSSLDAGTEVAFTVHKGDDAFDIVVTAKGTEPKAEAEAEAEVTE